MRQHSGLIKGFILAASSCVATISFYLLSLHVPLFLDANNRIYLCSASSDWSWSISNDCFRVGFLWPTILLLVSGIAAATLALCLAFFNVPDEDSVYATDGNASLFRLGIGNRKLPIRCPPGATIVIDNRLRMGIVGIIALFVQVGLLYFWHQHSDSQNSTYLFTSLQSVAFATALALYSTLVFLKSDRTLYMGLFPWPIAMSVLSQFACNLGEVYFSFFTIKNGSVPIFGRSAALQSNFLIGNTVLNLAMVIVLAMVQRHVIFLRPIVSSSLNMEADDKYYDASIDESTPFAYKNNLNECYLVDAPKSGSSILSRLLFSWSTEIFRRGVTTKLENKDMYRFNDEDASISNWKNYLLHRKKGRPMLIAIILTFISESLLAIFCTIITRLFDFAPPFFMQHILRYIENPSDAKVSGTLRGAYLYVFGLFFFANLDSVLSTQILWIKSSISMRITGILNGELAVKALRRYSKESLRNTDEEETDDESKATDDEGNIVNLVNIDASNVSNIIFQVDRVLNLPLTLGIGIYYIYQLLGVAALIGLMVEVLYIPLSKMIINRVIKLYKAQRRISDRRISMITEVLQGIKAVKLFGWETRFMQNIAEQHNIQLNYAWKIFSWRVVSSIMSELTPVAVFVFILYLYTIVFGNKLTAEIAFTSLTVYRTVYYTIMRAKNSFSSIADVFVSADRINTYLGSPETQNLEKRVLLDTGNTLGFKNADLEWITPEQKDKYYDQNTANRNVVTTDTDNGPVSEQTPLLSRKLSLAQAALTANGSAASLAQLNEMQPFSLKNIDIQFPIGEFSIIAGPTGSGKSSLLSALIGEMTLVHGNIMVPTVDSRVATTAAAADGSKYKDIVDISNEELVPHDIAYVGQETWLRNATFRENILFGEKYEKERYEEVLRVCALKPDLRIFPAGDRTEIGERGVTLSGGQKQRVALARAVYSHRRILLIDDCLSAVDAHTGKHILMECLLSKTKLMQGRTRVLITHHVPMCLPYADFMVMMNKGRIVLKGAPQDLKAQGVLTSALKELEGKAKSTDKDKQPADKEEDGKDKNIETNEESTTSDLKKSLFNLKSEDEYTEERLRKIAEQKNLDPNIDLTVLQGILVKEEEREEGRVKFEVWKTFIDICGGNTYWATVVAAMVVAEVFSTMKTYAIRLWVSSNESDKPGGIASSLLFSGSMGGTAANMAIYVTGADAYTTPTKNSPAYWLSIYMFVSALGAFWEIFDMYITCYGGIRAEKSLHKKLLCSVMHATPQFFDSTPVGRIVSRFSGDMDNIDQGSISLLISWLSGFVSLATTLVIIVSVIPPFVLPAAAIIAFCILIAYYYLATMREIKRIRKASMSPVISIFSEIINGRSTICTFGMKNCYVKEVLNRVSNANRLEFMNTLGNEWLEIRMYAISAAFTLICNLFILLNIDWIDAGLAGFMLTYASSFSSETNWTIYGYIYNERNMTSVERVVQYLKLDQEAPSESAPENKPSALWPKTGNVEFENLVAEYVPGVPVLHGISFSVHHGEKVGIVGRTGAGKSTMSLALLRFVEATKGQIVLDGVNISKIGLDDLRRNITIIPQDPVLFNGTIRYNIDPFEEYPDELIWDALNRVHMTREQTSHATSASTSIVEIANDENGEVLLERMAGVFSSLDDRIEQNGRSLSAGQRQLVAMARALVRRSKLIIMDEATASVDFDTDERLQRTIRGYEFANSTILCIAHRLRTIIDYDRVLVLDKGKVAEFDTPKSLLQKRDGIFRGMCEKSGEIEHLLAIANH